MGQWTRALAITACGALLCGACAPSRSVAPRAPAPGRGPRATSDFTRSAALEPPRRSSDCYVDVVFDRHPERPYVVLGRVSVSWLASGRTALGATEAVAVPLLRREACRAGAHVIFALETSSQDHLRQGSRRPRLSRSVQGTAVAAVYVRPSGLMEPPPASPGRVIRVPSHLAEDAAPTTTPQPSAEGLEEPEAIWEPGIDDPWAVPAP